jgi:hypothetical protein
MRNFAQRLITHEAQRNKSAKTPTSDGFDVCEKLRSQLATLMGNGGLRALLARALALASAEVSWLRGVRVKSDGALEGLEEIQMPLSLDELSEGKVALLAQLLGLLVAFIGENLTLRLVREAWPKAPLHNLDLVEGNKNEKTK